MTTPVQSAGPAQQGPPTRSGRAELARLWTEALIGTAYVPTARQDIERTLRALLDDLVDIIKAKGFSRIRQLNSSGDPWASCCIPTTSPRSRTPATSSSRAGAAGTVRRAGSG